MDDVAEAAGISKPVLYQHFASKQELYLEVVRQATGVLTGMLQEALHTEDDPRARVRSTIRAFFRFVDDSSAQCTVLFNVDAYEPEAVALFDGVRAELSGSIAQIVAHASGLDRQSAQFVGGTVTSMGESAARQAAAQPGLDREHAADVFATVLWSGLDSLYDLGG